MPSKLAKFCFALSFSLLLTSWSWATTNVYPISPWSRSVGTSAVAYSVTPTAYAGDTNYKINYDFTVLSTAAGEVSARSGAGQQSLIDNTNMLLFTVYSSKTDIGDPARNYILTVTMNANSADSRVPIAFFGNLSTETTGTDCNSTDCITETLADGTSFFAAVPLATKGMPATIGVYVADICKFALSHYGAPETAATLCSSAGTNNVATVDATSGYKTLPLKFNIYQTTGGSTNVTAASGSTTETDSITIKAQLSQPTLTCPANLYASYFPGDEQIYVDTGLFGGGTAISGNAVGTTLVGLASRTATPTPSSYQAIGRMPIQSGQQPFGGFVNTTDGTDNAYNISYRLRDDSGVFSNADPLCEFTGVKTSAIYGFLKQGQCFIATAAFQSDKAAPVSLLREFRGEVLLKSVLGRAFVRWYYSWSPDAALWLLENPDFRQPVLSLLLPLQIFAWICLRPLLLAALVLAGIAALLGSRFLVPRTLREVE